MFGQSEYTLYAMARERIQSNEQEMRRRVLLAKLPRPQLRFNLLTALFGMWH